MSKCLIDYVGIKICATDICSCGSGVYINSLPGISLKSIQATANEDQINYAGLWNDAQGEAWNIFVIDFRTAISECFDLCNQIPYEDIICDNKHLLVNPWRYLLGSVLMQYRLNTDRLNKFTTVDTKKATTLMDDYQSRYESALGQAVKLLDLTSFRMPAPDPRPKHVVWRP